MNSSKALLSVRWKLIQRAKPAQNAESKWLWSQYQHLRLRENCGREDTKTVNRELGHLLLGNIP